MKKLVPVLLTLMFLIGCSSTITVVNQEGIPVRNHDIILSHPYHGIETNFYIQRMVEASTDSVVPEYLNVYEKQNVKKADTKGLYMVLRMKNPKMNNVQLKKVITYRKLWGWEVLTIVNDLVYKGKDADKTWQISLPMEYGSYTASIQVDDGSDIPIVAYEFKYNVK